MILTMMMILMSCEKTASLEMFLKWFWNGAWKESVIGKSHIWWWLTYTFQPKTFIFLKEKQIYDLQHIFSWKILISAEKYNFPNPVYKYFHKGASYISNVYHLCCLMETPLTFMPGHSFPRYKKYLRKANRAFIPPICCHLSFPSLLHSLAAQYIHVWPWKSIKGRLNLIHCFDTKKVFLKTQRNIHFSNFPSSQRTHLYSLLLHIHAWPWRGIFNHNHRFDTNCISEKPTQQHWSYQKFYVLKLFPPTK